MKQLSLGMRPKTLDEMIGQERIVKSIRKQVKRSVPKAFLFCGGKGSGKTTIARILALSINCKSSKFGNPDIACRKKRSRFPIYEIDGAAFRGVEDVEKFIQQSEYQNLTKGRKVFIVDETHNLSAKAQDLFLKPLEDTDNDSVWIFCSTRPDKIIETLRSRCKVYVLRQFNRDNIEELVKRGLHKLHSKLNSDDLVESLLEKNVRSARLITHAIEKYADGDSAEDAASVDAGGDTEAMPLIRAVAKGNWTDTAKFLREKTNESNVRLMRSSVVAYLRTVLLESAELDDRGKTVANAIRHLAYVPAAEEQNQLGALAAELHTLCQMFTEYSL